ncbi:MAG TPA: MASE1 domain-containing protein [Verrucomicrobiae bacterium]|nr:MASE1 domain-containing protein [Verrucomicrobiae bacterium]
MNSGFSKLLRFVALAAMFFVAGKIGMLLRDANSGISPIWPATGIALAGLLLWGYRLWPAIFVGACLIDVTSHAFNHAAGALGIIHTLGIAGGDTLEALLGAWLVNRFANGVDAFLRVSDVFRFTIFAGVLGSAVSATVGVGTKLAGGFLVKQTFGTAWLSWWMGDMVGAIVVAPLILVWKANPSVHFAPKRALEAAGLLLSLLLVSAVNFSNVLDFGTHRYSLAFLYIPLLVWAALRFESRGVVTFVSIICCLAINGTWHGIGAFAIADENSSLLMLQTFICVATLTALVLAAAVAERKSAEEKFRRLSVELERRVGERTAQLEGINKELEAFCYSVSHDLRAPLRTIRGFSEVLLEQYLPHLDARGQDFLRRTCDAGVQMDKLIEDLLKLSRVTRGEIEHRRINLSAIANDIAGQLARSEPKRHVEFAIAPEVSANGDERLLRLVLDNLLRNAWKFTGKQPHPRIEFGRQNGESSPFFVRDNGVGFDMAYAGKLFGVFQRLHSSAEFGGSGVGLAIVQRVVNRHGGRVWADAKTDSGATFYFTLPSAEPV